MLKGKLRSNSAQMAEKGLIFTRIPSSTRQPRRLQPTPPAAHLWVGSAHARQHSWKHVPALVPRPATHRQLEQVHQDTRVVHNQQTSEFIQGLKFWAWRFILAFNILKKLNN